VFKSRSASQIDQHLSKTGTFVPSTSLDSLTTALAACAAARSKRQSRMRDIDVVLATVNFCWPLGMMSDISEVDEELEENHLAL
jgi:hypothetical protein